MLMRVLVCGGRDYNDREHVFAVLDRFQRQFGIAMVIQGGASGADAHAAAWARDRVVPCLSVPADWGRLGKFAGRERNGRMLRIGQPEKVIAFPGGVGTANMIEQARAADVEVIEIKPRGAST